MDSNKIDFDAACAKEFFFDNTNPVSTQNSNNSFAYYGSHSSNINEKDATENGTTLPNDNNYVEKDMPRQSSSAFIVVYDKNSNLTNESNDANATENGNTLPIVSENILTYQTNASFLDVKQDIIYIKESLKSLHQKVDLLSAKTTEIDNNILPKLPLKTLKEFNEFEDFLKENESARNHFVSMLFVLCLVYT